MAIKAIKHSLF